MPDPAPVAETPAPAVEAPVYEAPAPVLDEPITAVEVPTPSQPNLDVTQTAPAAEPVARALEPNITVIGGPEPDEFAQLRQDLGSATVVGGPVPNAFTELDPSFGTSTVVGGPVPDDFTDLGQTLANSTVVGGPVPNEFAGIGQPLAGGSRAGSAQVTSSSCRTPNRSLDPNIALFAPPRCGSSGATSRASSQPAALNSALLGPADHTAQYSPSLGVDWVENGRDHACSRREGSSPAATAAALTPPPKRQNPRLAAIVDSG